MDPFSPDVVRDYEPIHPKGTDWRGLLRKIWAPIAAVIGIAIKFGVAFAKFASIFVAVGGYALIWGWKFAVGLVFLLLVHEMGHYIEARRQGLHPALPVFIPFLGAYVKHTRGNPRSSYWTVPARISRKGAMPRLHARAVTSSPVPMAECGSMRAGSVRRSRGRRLSRTRSTCYRSCHGATQLDTRR